MTGIAQRVEADWDHLTARLRNQAPETSAQSTSSQPEVQPMTVSARLADAEKAVEALASHIKALASNPLVDTLIEVSAGIFLTPAEVLAVRAFVQTLEAGRAPAENAVTAGEGVVAAFDASGQPQEVPAAAKVM